MRYSVVIDLDGDAFQGESRSHEVARLLRELADRTENGGRLHVGRLLDANGNTCCAARVTR